MCAQERDPSSIGPLDVCIAYAAATWALIFAVAHILWATGWYVGLDTEPPQVGLRRQLFLAYDLLVAAACAFGVPVALAGFRSWGPRLQTRAVRIVVWFGTALLMLRAAASLVQVAYHLSSQRLTRLGLWEPWFYLGAILFGFTTWRFWSRQPITQTSSTI
jgi:hypothetical protein